MSDSVTLWTVACHVPLSLGFTKQDYWNGLPFPPLRDLPNPVFKPAYPVSAALQADRFFFCLFLIYFSWRLITLQHCSCFCHTLIDSLSAVLQQLKKNIYSKVFIYQFSSIVFIYQLDQVFIYIFQIFVENLAFIVLLSDFYFGSLSLCH